MGHIHSCWLTRLARSKLSSALLILTPLTATAQTAGQESGLRLFLDCQTDCDFDFIRREIGFVSFVRDRTDSQVHLLITAEGTGGGGRRYTLNFIGNREFSGVADTLRLSTPQTDTDDLRRTALVRTIKIGLMRFVARSPAAAGIRISYEAPKAAEASAEPARDPWNYWVFRVNANGNAGGEALRSNFSLNGTLTANRTTEDWKFSFRLNGRYSESRVTLSDSSEFVNDTREYNSQTQLVKSVSDHFSAGLNISGNSSIFSNEEISVRVAPAVEYSLFPYEESSRRALTLTYTIGVRSVSYHEETIYFKTAETLANQRLELGYGMQQPWGEFFFSLGGSHYFHDAGLYRVEMNGNTDIRLFRGFSVNFGGDYSRIHDQLSLRRRDASDEELIAQRQQLRTNYRYGIRMGLSYSFGSIFNNVVNPRM